MEKTKKNDDQIMKVLGVHTINRLICYTDKGPLTLQIRKGEKDYNLILDSVPLDKEKNSELMEILFPIPKMDIPQVNKEVILNPSAMGKIPVITTESSKKLGRPKKK